MNQFWEPDSRPDVEAARQAWIDTTWEADKVPVFDASPEAADAAFETYFDLFMGDPKPELEAEL